VEAEEQADGEPPDSLERPSATVLHALRRSGDSGRAGERCERRCAELEPEQEPRQRLQSGRQARSDEGRVANEQADGDAFGHDRAAPPEARDDRLRQREPETAQDEHDPADQRDRLVA
jgi:hypothetical protein